jgi:ribosome-associated protein
MRDVQISVEPTELCKILKFAALVPSGGEAKNAIADGKVLVNGVMETRKRRKILAGDVIAFGDDELRVCLK